MTRRTLLAGLAGAGLNQPVIGASGAQPGAAHDLYFDMPSKVWDEALPLGNGMLGALLWGDGNPVYISLDRADLWDLRAVPEFSSADYSFEQMRRWHEEGKVKELIRLYEDPYNRPAPTKIPAGRIEISFGKPPQFRDASLSLAHASAQMTFTNGDRLSLFVHGTERIGVMRLRSENNPAIRLIAPHFSGKVERSAQGGITAGDLAQLGYSPPEERRSDHWCAYRQQGAEGLRFAVFVGWKKHGSEWQAAWSIASIFESSDPLDLARQRVLDALEKGYDLVFRPHREWWQEFWSRSSVSLPNRIIERQWYREQYKFGSASRRGSPPVTLQAVWTADNGGLPPWKGDYHHDLNTQLSYWPCYSSNHLEEGLSYLDWLWKIRDAAFAWTKRFFKMPGLNVPMTTDLNGNQIGGWRQYAHSATTAAWLAQHFYLHWRFSADREFLAERAYPYLSEASEFIDAFTAQKDHNGKRLHPLSSSPEINDNEPTAWFPSITNYDLALQRWLLGATAELAAELRRWDDEARWRRILSEFPDFSLGEDGRLLVAANYPLKESHRHFSHLMAIHPLGLIDVEDGPSAQRIIAASLADLRRLGSDRWCGYSFAWLANMAARARNGETAEQAIEIFSTAFVLRNSFHCNGDQSGKGYSKYRYHPFTLEGNFAAAAGIQEMLLQSHRGRVLLFPAIPRSWKDIAFTTLRAQGAFLISAELAQGRLVRVEVSAEKGGTCRLVLPGGGKELSLTMKPQEHRLLRQGKEI